MAMGALEKRSSERMRKTKLTAAVTGVLAAGGAVALAAVTPGVIAALGATKLLPQLRYRANSTLNRMIMKGYARVEVRNGKRHVLLTEKGERFASLMDEGKLFPKKSRKWDGKWRIVAYDFYKEATTLRARVRELLRSWGFVMLQQSVWVFPYDAEDLVFLLKKEYGLGKNLLYVIAEEVENDKALRAHFNLPSR